jgi:hypothetical protein
VNGARPLPLDVPSPFGASIVKAFWLIGFVGAGGGGVPPPGPIGPLGPTAPGVLRARALGANCGIVRASAVTMITPCVAGPKRKPIFAPLATTCLSDLANSKALTGIAASSRSLGCGRGRRFLQRVREADEVWERVQQASKRRPYHFPALTQMPACAAVAGRPQRALRGRVYMFV